MYLKTNTEAWHLLSAARSVSGEGGALCGIDANKDGRTFGIDANKDLSMCVFILFF